MRPLMFTLAAVSLFSLQPEARAQAQPAPKSPDTIQELFGYLYQCAHTPPGPEASELTLRFSLTHFGTLNGKPMITYSKLAGSPEEQRAFVSWALGSLEKCLPVPLTEHFGKVVAQKMIVMRFPRPRARGV